MTSNLPTDCIAEETARIINGRLDLAAYLAAYLAADRSGSAHRLSRADRKAIFASVAVRPENVDEAVAFAKLGWTVTVAHLGIAGRSVIARRLGFDAPASWIA